MKIITTWHCREILQGKEHERWTPTDWSTLSYFPGYANFAQTHAGG
jgi:hypothetical protein